MALDAVKKFGNMTLTELRSLASSCKTSLVALNTIINDKQYLLDGDDTARQQFINITNFLYNCSIKDSEIFRENENDMSAYFWSILEKYFKSQLNNSDIINLISFIKGFNQTAFDYFVEGAKDNLYGLDSEGNRVNDTNFLFAYFRDMINRELNDIVNYATETFNTDISEVIDKSDFPVEVSVTTIEGDPPKEVTTQVTVNVKEIFAEFSDKINGLASNFVVEYESLFSSFNSMRSSNKQSNFESVNRNDVVISNACDDFAANNINKVSLFKRIFDASILNNGTVHDFDPTTDDGNQSGTTIGVSSNNDIDITNPYVLLYYLLVKDESENKASPLQKKKIECLNSLLFSADSSVYDNITSIESLTDYMTDPRLNLLTYTLCFDLINTEAEDILGKKSQYMRNIKECLTDFLNEKNPISDGENESTIGPIFIGVREKLGLTELPPAFTEDGSEEVQRFALRARRSNEEKFTRSLSLNVIELSNTVISANPNKEKPVYPGDIQINLLYSVLEDGYMLQIPLIQYRRNYNITLNESGTGSQYAIKSFTKSDVLNDFQIYESDTSNTPISLSSIFPDTINLTTAFTGEDGNNVSNDLHEEIIEFFTKGYGNITSNGQLVFEEIDGDETFGTQDGIDALNTQILKYTFGSASISTSDPKRNVEIRASLQEILSNLSNRLFETKKDKNGNISDSDRNDIIDLFEPFILIELKNDVPTVNVGNVYLSNLVSDMNGFSIARVIKEFIFSYNPTLEVSGSEKRSASNFEVTSADDKEQLVFIDLRNCRFSPSEAAQISKLIMGNEVSDPITQNVLYTLVILYKELNPAIRNVLLSDLQEYVFSRIIMKRSLSSIFNSDSGARTPTDSIQSLFRTFTDYNNYLPITSDSLYKYLYANAYSARTDTESSIIAYYYGNEDINNGYGLKSNEITEIMNFLEIYESSRNVFYKVLLNKSFINEDEYSLYEKLFISFSALERFISSKIDNIHDIDYFDSSDVKNFLISYGLKALTEMKTFVGQYEQQLTVVKHYNELVKSKGSRKAIEILMDIFDTSTTDIDLKKYYLIKTYNPDKTFDAYKFIEIPYDSDNEFAEIMNALDSGTEYDTFIESDPYWTLENVPMDILDQLNLTVNETKYSSLNIRHNIFYEYLLTRYMLSAIRTLDRRLIDVNAQNYVPGIEESTDKKRVFANMIGLIQIEVKNIQIYVYELVDLICFLMTILNRLNDLYLNVSNAALQSGQTDSKVYPVFTFRDMQLSVRPVSSKNADGTVQYNNMIFLGEENTKIPAPKKATILEREAFKPDFDVYSIKDIHQKITLSISDSGSDVVLKVGNSEYTSEVLSVSDGKIYSIRESFVDTGGGDTTNFTYQFSKSIKEQLPSAVSYTLDLSGEEWNPDDPFNLLESSRGNWVSDSNETYVAYSRYHSVNPIYNLRSSRVIGWLENYFSNDVIYNNTDKDIEANKNRIKTLVNELLKQYYRYNPGGTQTEADGEKEIDAFHIMSLFKTTETGDYRFTPPGGSSISENNFPIFNDLNETIPSTAGEIVRDIASPIKVYNLTQSESPQHNGIDKIKTYVESLNYLAINEPYLLWAYYIDKITSTDSNTIRTQAQYQEVVTSDWFGTVMEPLLQLPLDYHMGAFMLPVEDQESYKWKRYKNFLDTIIDEVYTADYDNTESYSMTFSSLQDSLSTFFSDSVTSILNITNTSKGTASTMTFNGVKSGVTSTLTTDQIDAAITEVSDTLIEILSVFQETFSGQELAQINISMSENENRLADYITAAIEFFISYTTKLYNTTFSKLWDTESESFPVVEDLKIFGRAKYTDAFQVEEELKVRIKENTQGTIDSSN